MTVPVDHLEYSMKRLAYVRRAMAQFAPLHRDGLADPRYSERIWLEVAQDEICPPMHPDDVGPLDDMFLLVYPFAVDNSVQLRQLLEDAEAHMRQVTGFRDLSREERLLANGVSPSLIYRHMR